MKWLLRVNWLGIDVALGAGALSYALSLTWNRIMPWHAYVLLILVVWLIYAVDHLRDVYVHRDSIITSRRHFHSRFHKNILATMAVVIVITFSLLTRLDVATILPGMLLAALVGMYFVFLQLIPAKMAVIKEIAAAVFYTLGICLIPFAAGPIHEYFIVHAFQVFLLALANLILFSWFDYEEDKKEGFRNMVSSLGQIATKRMLLTLIFLNISLCAILLNVGFQSGMEVCFILMNLVLLLPLINPVYWARNYRFRIAGDAIFFLPLLIMLDGKF